MKLQEIFHEKYSLFKNHIMPTIFYIFVKMVIRVRKYIIL